MYSWSLESIYPGFDSPAYKQDIEKLDTLIDELKSLANNLGNHNSQENLVNIINLNINFSNLVNRLSQFISLTLATDTTNEVATNQMIMLNKKIVQTTHPSTICEKYILSIENLDEIINQHPLLKEHEFYLKEIKEQGKYLLTDEAEVLVAQLRQSGSSLWAKQWSSLTSTLEVDYEGEKISLSKVRNLAYDKDPEVRKKAYFAELESYKKIEKSVAFSLNGIKNEVITMAKARGYQDPLDKTLKDSRLDKEVLDALLESMEESLPIFHKYLKRKAEMLGHKNGLPFYDLFAPMGNSQKVYTIEEAQEFIIKHFSSFSDNLAALAKKAFDNQWIDYLPKLGKRGGAFCAKIHPIKESRILTNFDGSIGDIITIAHELGHAYHNKIIFEQSILNSRYSMSLAETSSVLCETIVKKAAINEANAIDEKLAILEQELQDSTQVIVDIYSRYLFESKVFELCEKQFLNENHLNEMMKEAQLKAYGDSLDPNYLHPGMWINKSHYYSGGLSFYNFPYAFGLLFSKGIYAKYLENGPSFVHEIDRLLANTGRMNISDVAKSIGIDISQKEFWKKSLSLIEEDINLFMELTKEMI